MQDSTSCLLFGHVHLQRCSFDNGTGELWHMVFTCGCHKVRVDLVTGRAPSAPSMFHGDLYIPRERDLVSWNKNTAPLGAVLDRSIGAPQVWRGPLCKRQRTVS